MCDGTPVITALIDAATIRQKVAELASEIVADYGDHRLVVIGILTGAVRFMMDLLSNMPDEFARNVDYDFIGVSSYAGSQSLGEVTVKSEPAVDLRLRHVLVVDGIVDTGLTLHRVLSCIRARSPESVKVCALLDKGARRQRDVPVDYCGFSVGDDFVVGYGLDLEHRHRSLPYIGVLDSQAPAPSSKRG